MCLQVVCEVEGLHRFLELGLVHFAESLKLKELPESGWRSVRSWTNGLWDEFSGATVISSKPFGAVGAEYLGPACQISMFLNCEKLIIFFIFDYFFGKWREYILIIVFAWTRIICLVEVV